MSDTVTIYLEEACSIADSIEPMNDYMYLFETSDGNEQAVAAERDILQKESKSKNILQKAIDAIKGAIRRLKSIIQNFLAKRRMSPEQRAEYEKFCQEIRSNPEFANKKVSVMDWQAIKKEYNRVIKDIEKQIDYVKRTEEECKPNIMKTLESRVSTLGDTARKATVQIKLDQLVNRAKWDPNFAKDLDIALDGDSRILDALTKGMNKRDINKAKKAIHAYASEISLRRLIMKARQSMMSIEQQAEKERLDASRTFQKSLYKSKKYLSAEDKRDAIDIYKRSAGKVINDTMDDVRNIRANKKSIKKLNAVQKWTDKQEAKRDAVKNDPKREERAKRREAIEKVKKESGKRK